MLPIKKKKVHAKSLKVVIVVAPMATAFTQENDCSERNKALHPVLILFSRVSCSTPHRVLVEAVENVKYCRRKYSMSRFSQTSLSKSFCLSFLVPIIPLCSPAAKVMSRSLARSRHKPLQYRIKVGLLLCTDPIAAHLAMRYTLQVERFDNLVGR